MKTIRLNPRSDRQPVFLTRLVRILALASLALILGTAVPENTVVLAMPSVGSRDVNPGIEMPKGEVKLLQFTAGGHVLGFSNTGLYVAAGDHALKTEFVGARRVKPQAEGGSWSESSKAPPMGRVTYESLWDGVTLVYDRDAGGIVRSTYYIAPQAVGSDPVRNIRLAYNVALSKDKSGNLVLGFETGNMVESAPVAWQEIDGKRVPVDVSFTISDKKQVGFHVSAYDPAWPLIIDPTLTWNTFLGGAGADTGSSIAVDAAGNVYVTGNSDATWGVPVNPFNGGLRDAFVARLNGTTGALIWHTFLGGAGDDAGLDITVDVAGNVYVTGNSDTTWGAPVNPYGGGFFDAFVARLNGTTGALIWHTFLGGTGNDGGSGIAVDAANNVYVTGSSGAWGTPVRPFGGIEDTYVARLNGTTGALVWHTFLGGIGLDFGNDIAVGAAGNVYVTGQSDGTWGTPANPFNGGLGDAFVARLNGTTGALIWHTFLGGTGSDSGSGIAVDVAGNVYVTGNSDATWGAPVNPYGGGFFDAFVARLNGTTGALIWHTFLGGTGSDSGSGIAVDAAGNVYATGNSDATWSTPVNPYVGGPEAFVARLNGATGALIWNTFLANVPTPVPLSNIALDVADNIYVITTTGGTYFFGGGVSDAFIVKIAPTCTTALMLNGALYRTGDLLTLGANLVPWPGASMVDGYVSVQTPGGQTIFLKPGGMFSLVQTPMVTSWTVVPFNGQIFAYTFTGTEPPGVYSVTGFFTQPGTLTPTGPQFCPTGFGFLP